MTYDLSAIRLGASKITFAGSNLGFTKDGITVEVKTTTRRVDIDHFTHVETLEVVLKRELSVKMTLLETNISTLDKIIGASGAIVAPTANGDRLILPVAAGLTMHNSGQTLLIHPVDRADSDLSEDITISNAVWSGNITFTSKVDDVRTFAVEFLAYRDSGDALFRYGP